MKKIMKAAVFEKEGVLKIKEVPVPEIKKPDDLIVEVELCSICGTDVHIMSVPPGYIAKPGTILGHELVGRVVAAGEGVKTIQIGDRVVVNPNDYCGVCDYCKLNLPNECENIVAMGIEADGGFAQYVRMSEKVAFKVAPDLPAELAAFAEPLACLVNGISKIRVNPGESVTIIGAGPIGLMYCKAMKACGAYPVIVSEPSALRQEFAKKCGADYVINPIEQNLEVFVKEVTKIGTDVAIDVVGSQMYEAVKAVKKGGRVLLFGMNKKAEPTVIQSEVTTKEVTLYGTWLANASFPRAVKILEEDSWNLKDLITHTLPLEKLEEGIELLRNGEAVEVLIVPDRGEGSV